MAWRDAPRPNDRGYDTHALRTSWRAAIMAFEQGASDLTADFLQREKQAAGVLLGDDETLFGAPSAGEHDFERRAHEFPALDDDGAFEAALSKSHDAPAVQQAPVVSDEEHFRVSYPDMDAPVSGLDAEDAQHAWEATAPRMQKETLYELERDVPAPEPEPATESTPQVTCLLYTSDAADE